MKIILALLTFSSFTFAGHYENTEVVDCRVTRMLDYTYFEEGLSAYEYPDVDVRVSPYGQYSVSIGGHQAYELAEGDQVTFKHERHKGTIVHVKLKHGDEVQLEIEWRRTLAKLAVRVKEGNRRMRTVAYGVCNKGIF